MIRLNIFGLPQPQGSKKGFLSGGRVVIVDVNPKALKAWRQQVARSVTRYREKYPEHEPYDACTLDVTFWLPAPKTMPKGRTVPCVRPDLDKLVRALMDGLDGLYVDDSRVVDITARKRYTTVDGRAPGATVVLEPV